MEALKDGLDRVLPQKTKSSAVPAVGIGNIGSGMVNYEDDVSPRSPLFIPYFVTFHTTILLRSSFNNHLRNQPLPCMPLHGPVWGTGLAPLPAATMGCLARGHSFFFSYGLVFRTLTPLTCR
jgi:hypothetical protein